MIPRVYVIQDGIDLVCVTKSIRTAHKKIVKIFEDEDAENIIDPPTLKDVTRSLLAGQDHECGWDIYIRCMNLIP